MSTTTYAQLNRLRSRRDLLKELLQELDIQIDELSPAESTFEVPHEALLIFEAVEQVTGFSREQLAQRGRFREIVDARCIFSWLAYLAGMNYADTARCLGMYCYEDGKTIPESSPIRYYCKSRHKTQLNNEHYRSLFRKVVALLNE